MKSVGGNAQSAKIKNYVVDQNIMEGGVCEVVARALAKEEAIVNLSHREIRVIPAEIVTLTSTKVLLLNNNKILMPPEEICHLQQLESISLEHNQLTILPSGIADLSSTLQFLNLSHNPLTYVSPAVGMLENLKSLWLGYTGLQGFPEEVCNLSKLTHLSLEGNQIASVAINTSSLKELQWLSLAKNILVAASFSFPSLTTLNLSNNLLTDYPHGISCPKLSNLNLQGNKLSHVPADIQRGFDQKVEVDIRNNPITEATKANV